MNELLEGNRNSYCTGSLFLSPDRRRGSAAAVKRKILSRGILRQCSIGLLPRPEEYDDADYRRTERDDLVDPEIRTVFVKTNKVDAETEYTRKYEVQSEHLTGVVFFVQTVPQKEKEHEPKERSIQLCRMQPELGYWRMTRYTFFRELQCPWQCRGCAKTTAVQKTSDTRKEFTQPNRRRNEVAYL